MRVPLPAPPASNALAVRAERRSSSAYVNVSSTTISAGCSARSRTIWANSSGKVEASLTSEPRDGGLAVPRLGGGAHGGEPHRPRLALLEELDHEPEGGRRVDPARARPAA